jgi:hypothetical protein
MKNASASVRSPGTGVIKATACTVARGRLQNRQELEDPLTMRAIRAQRVSPPVRFRMAFLDNRRKARSPNMSFRSRFRCFYSLAEAECQRRSLTIAARHSFHVAILRDGYGSARAGDRSERLARAAGKCAAVVLAVILPDHMQAC